jgi:acyl-CoA thioester hydrolase
MIRVPRLEPPADPISHTIELRVRFGDTDAAGIVYYANYLRYFEAGRAEFMRSVGMPYGEVVKDGYILPVVETWCRYRAPAVYDDLIEVVTWLHEHKHASLLIGSQIMRGDRLLAEGATRIGSMRADGTPCRLPPELRSWRK